MRLSSKSIAEAFPELIKEWHPTKNGINTPYNVSFGSHIEIIWLCDKNHEFSAPPNRRTSLNSRCPYCSGKKAWEEHNLAFCHPEIAKDWHPTLNTLSPFEVTPASGKMADWLCPKGHHYSLEVYRRTCLDMSCPTCPTLSFLYPELASQWHSTKNKVPVTKFRALSNKKGWWQCPANIEHVFPARIEDRVKLYNQGYSGCPYCRGWKVCSSNCLRVTHPHLAKEWSLKNTLTPDDVTASSGEKVLWNCPKGHEYSTFVNARQRGVNCSVCRSSRGEEIVRRLLEDMELPFEFQWKDDRCKNRRALPFDFAILSSEGGQALGLIEFHGIQHYEPCKYFGGRPRFDDLKINDQIKEDFCQAKNIPLLVIPYFEDEPREMAEMFVKTLKSEGHQVEIKEFLDF